MRSRDEKEGEKEKEDVWEPFIVLLLDPLTVSPPRVPANFSPCDVHTDRVLLPHPPVLSPKHDLPLPSVRPSSARDSLESAPFHTLSIQNTPSLGGAFPPSCAISLAF